MILSTTSVCTQVGYPLYTDFCLCAFYGKVVMLAGLRCGVSTLACLLCRFFFLNQILFNNMLAMFRIHPVYTAIKPIEGNEYGFISLMVAKSECRYSHCIKLIHHSQAIFQYLFQDIINSKTQVHCTHKITLYLAILVYLIYLVTLLNRVIKEDKPTKEAHPCHKRASQHPVATSHSGCSTGSEQLPSSVIC